MNRTQNEFLHRFDVSSRYNIQSKKFDYIRIAYILNTANQPMTAEQIYYHWTKIFRSNIMKSRIAQVMRQYPNNFPSEWNHRPRIRIYQFNGQIKINRTTKHNWDNKSKKVF